MSSSSSDASGNSSYTFCSRMTWHVEHAHTPAHAPSKSISCWWATFNKLLPTLHGVLTTLPSRCFHWISIVSADDDGCVSDPWFRLGLWRCKAGVLFAAVVTIDPRRFFTLKQRRYMLISSIGEEIISETHHHNWNTEHAAAGAVWQ